MQSFSTDAAVGPPPSSYNGSLKTWSSFNPPPCLSHPWISEIHWADGYCLQVSDFVFEGLVLPARGYSELKFEFAAGLFLPPKSQPFVWHSTVAFPSHALCFTYLVPSWTHVPFLPITFDLEIPWLPFVTSANSSNAAESWSVPPCPWWSSYWARWFLVDRQPSPFRSLWLLCLHAASPPSVPYCFSSG